MMFLSGVLFLLLVGALASLLFGRNPLALITARLFSATACFCGLIWSIIRLLADDSLSGSLPLPLPIGECLFHVDFIALAFLIPVFLIGGIAGLLLPSRIMAIEQGEGYPPERQAHYGRHGFFFCILIASIVLVLTAADAVFFLISWELMALSPFFLISPWDRDSKERYACWVYLVAAHLGVLPLMLLFAGMSVETGSTAFAAFNSFGSWKSASLFFCLGLIGFGVKAGLVPLHVWMPEAYPSAPGHVAMVLSGAMANLGIYGIVRLLVMLPSPQIGYLAEDWWAYMLMAAGAFSGIIGILLSVVQADIRRALAYSSSENMGIICLALGAAVLAAHNNAVVACVLLLGGALLHMWSHSLCKSLLFLGVNALVESIRITDLNRLGGLFKYMPFTGGCFALGCASIAGVAPLNGLLGELLMYVGFAQGAWASANSVGALMFWAALIALGGVAGLAMFAFARIYGLAFSGAPRTAVVLEAHEPDRWLRASMGFLAFMCVAMALGGVVVLGLLSPAVELIASHFPLAEVLTKEDLDFARSVIRSYSLFALLIFGLLGLVWLARKRMVARNGSLTGMTWDCGYRYPSTRMQYTGGSFSHSLVQVMKSVLQPEMTMPTIDGYFPSPARAMMEVPDKPIGLWESIVFRPVTLVAEWSKKFQSGLVNIYVLYIFIALTAALVWALGWS